MSRPVAVVGLACIVLMGTPPIVSACAVSHPLPATVLAADADREGRAWAVASLVYVAEITGTADNYEFFELTPRRVLKGELPDSVLTVPEAPTRGMCNIYHGLNVRDGAGVGDEFIVYVLSEPARADGLYIVSARMLGDPSTRAALTLSRRRR